MRLTTIGAGLLLALPIIACAAAGPSFEKIVGDHMTAEAMLAAHYVAAARKAGMTEQQISDTLKSVADATVIEEFWVTDESGKIVATNMPNTPMVFERYAINRTQASDFYPLLSGVTNTVVQNLQERPIDGKRFKYVGVSGIDQKRAILIGVAAENVEIPAPPR
jgi:hypothetical protein